jgi:hypothetical protein
MDRAGAILDGVWSVVGKTLIGAGLILSLIGLARSVGFSVGLLPGAPVRVRHLRVVFDGAVVVAFVYLSVSQLVDKNGRVDLGDITDLDWKLSRPWSYLVPAGIAGLWLYAAVRTFRQGRALPVDPAHTSPALVVRSLANPDKLFRAGRGMDTWIKSELTELRQVLWDVLLGHVKFLFVRADPLAEFSRPTQATRPAAGTDGDAQAGRIPVGAVALVWTWALWQVPTMLGWSFTALQIRVLGGVLPQDTTSVLEKFSWLGGPGFGRVDLIVLGTALFAYVMPRGSVLGNALLVAVGLALLTGLIAVVCTAYTAALWSIVMAVPVLFVLFRLGTAQTYRTHGATGGRGIGNDASVVLKTVAAVAVMTLIGSWFAADSYANAFAGTSGETSTYYRQALGDLTSYAAWALAYLLGIHFLALLFTHWRIGPLSVASVASSAFLLPTLGFLALSFVLPRTIVSGAGQVAYLGETAAAVAGPAPQAWIAGPVLCVFGYTLAILTLTLRSGGTLRVAAPEPVALN